MKPYIVNSPIINAFSLGLLLLSQGLIAVDAFTSRYAHFRTTTMVSTTSHPSTALWDSSHLPPVELSSGYIPPKKTPPPMTGSGFPDDYIRQHSLFRNHCDKINRRSQAIVSQCIQRKNGMGQAAEILSLAFGTSPDISKYQKVTDTFENLDFHFTILEYDERAMNLVKNNLNPAIVQKFDFVQGNVLNLGLEHVLDDPYDGYDLIVAGGLFDSLPDVMVIQIIEYLFNNVLAAGGYIAFTSISASSGYSTLRNVATVEPEPLFPRTDDELFELCEDAGVWKNMVTITHGEAGRSRKSRLIAIRKPIYCTKVMGWETM